MGRHLLDRLWMVLLWFVLITPLVSAENLETPHFLIIYPTSDTSLAKTIAESMEKARETLTEELGVSHENPLKIKLVSHVANKGYARYLPDRRTIEVLTAEGMTRNLGGQSPPLRFVKGVLWHEYTHFLQHQAMRRFIKDRTALWFIEGTAELLGTLRFIGRYSPEAVWREGETILSRSRLPTLDDLNRYHQTNQYPMTTYFFSSDAVAFLVQKWGMDPLRQITKDMGGGRKFPQCVDDRLGIDLKTFERQWHDHLKQRYKSYMRNS